MFEVGDIVRVLNTLDNLQSLVDFSIDIGDAKVMLGKVAHIIEVRQFGDKLIYKLLGEDFSPHFRNWYVHANNIVVDNTTLTEFNQLIGIV